MVQATYEVGPLPDEVPFGATVRGLTLERLQDAAVRRSLFDLWIDKGVLFFPGPSTQALHVALSQCFGTLERHPFPDAWVDGYPELTNANFFPQNGTAYEIDGEPLGGWLPWHSDLTYVDRINRGGILRAIQLPNHGGLTGFIDQIAAYERLPRALKDRIDGLNVVYSMDQNIERMRYGRPRSVRQVQRSKTYLGIMGREYQYPRVVHPMVYEQAETGRKVLNVSPWFALGVYELGEPEGVDLLREVVDRCIDDARGAYFHHWQPGDMVLWDNWRTLHSSSGVPLDQTRIMQRTTISGDYALGRTLEKKNAERLASAA